MKPNRVARSLKRVPSTTRSKFIRPPWRTITSGLGRLFWPSHRCDSTPEKARVSCRARPSLHRVRDVRLHRHAQARAVQAAGHRHFVVARDVEVWLVVAALLVPGMVYAPVSAARTEPKLFVVMLADAP